MLKIILSKKGASSKSGGEKAATGEGVTISCPDHLVLSDLPVAKSIGSVPTTTRVKHVGFTIPHKAGEKSHFCVCCDYPIAVYGRLSPCGHAFCLDCARSDSSCYICKAHIQNITAIKKGNGIFICGLTSCRKSFLEKSSLQAHFEEIHGISESICANDGNDGDLCLQPIEGTLPRPFSVVAPRPSCHQLTPHGTQLLYPSPFTMASVYGSVNVSPLGPAGQAALTVSRNHSRSQKIQPDRVHLRSSNTNQTSAYAFSSNDRVRPTSNEGDGKQKLRILLSKRE